MTAQTLETTVRHTNDYAVIDLQGDINGLSDASLQLAFQQAVDQQPAAILLNFSQVHYINSTGIALIVGLMAQSRKAHIKLLTYGLSDHYKEIFTITRLSDFMTIVTDEDAALSAIQAN